jgi:ATP-dependent Clp endopeptidase proteolytic subunit ClpP
MKDIYWLGGKGSKQKSENDQAKEDLAGLLSMLSGPPTAGKDDDNMVEVKNNAIYFYSEVVRPKILTLNKNLAELGKNLVNQSNLLSLPEPGSIHLHINSFGGSVFAGLSAVDYIESCDVPVISIVEGCAASAATIMSVAAHHRQIRKNSFMLIHQLSSGMWGKYEELKDSMTNNDQFMTLIKDYYSDRTKIPKKKLNEILKRDLWFDAETCLEYGLVDEII